MALEYAPAANWSRHAVCCSMSLHCSIATASPSLCLPCTVPAVVSCHDIAGTMYVILGSWCGHPPLHHRHNICYSVFLIWSPALYVVLSSWIDFRSLHYPCNVCCSKVLIDWSTLYTMASNMCVSVNDIYSWGFKPAAMYVIPCLWRSLRPSIGHVMRVLFYVLALVSCNCITVP